MTIGVPKEIKNNENRVGMVPDGVREIAALGHKVIIETGAGVGSGFSDEDYVAAGAVIADKAALFAEADWIVKVKEPIAVEYEYFREGQQLFTYLHLAADRPQTQMLLDKNITGVAYETVQAPDGTLPLLTPMSEVAGRMSVQVGATLLQKYYGGKGVLLGGVPGVNLAEVVIIGGGVVGTNAAKMALGMGARVTIFDVSRKRLGYLDDIFGGKVATVMSSAGALAAAVKKADLLIGAVLVPGAKAPRLVTEDMVKSMAPGSVIVDVAIDQGGSIETIDRITTHENPCYIKHGVVHYSVANMPGAVPRTSTFALTGMTIQYLKRLLSSDFKALIAKDAEIRTGLNTYKGQVTNQGVADAFGYEFVDPISL